MELSWEVGIVSWAVVHPWMEQIKRNFFPVLAAFLQPRYSLLLLLSGTTPRLSLHPSLAFLLRSYQTPRLNIPRAFHAFSAF